MSKPIVIIVDPYQINLGENIVARAEAMGVLILRYRRESWGKKDPVVVLKDGEFTKPENLDELDDVFEELTKLELI